MNGHASITVVQSLLPQFDEEAEEGETESDHDENIWSLLQIASARGDLAAVSRLLDQGTSPNDSPKGW